MITRFTVTGADNSTDIDQLNDLIYKFPFVEWGILVSGKQFGNNRFPSIDWISDLRNKIHESANLSCHLCGQYVKDILLGKDTAIKGLGVDLWSMFDRVQINTHGYFHPHNQEMITLLHTYENKEFIFQHDGVNDAILKDAYVNGIKCSTLFDLSHGAGVLPSEWPMPLQNIKCGYAGGLSPENLESQIQLIEGKVGDTQIWLDLETHARSNNDQLFDLAKVEKCLQITSKYIK